MSFLRPVAIAVEQGEQNWCYQQKLLLALSTLFWGCASVEEVKKEAVEDTQALRKGPVSAPQKTHQHADSLRCMDRLFRNGIATWLS